MNQEVYDRLAKTAALFNPGEVILESPIVVNRRVWKRFIIKTHIIQMGEDLVGVVRRYASPHIRLGDIVFVGHKATAIAQGRYVHASQVRPRWLARFLAARIRRRAFGYGLSKPTTMEVAIREIGVPMILVACAAHLVGRALGRHGDFYRVAGVRVSSIDGTTTWAQPPYNEYIVLAPKDPDKLAQRIADRLGARAAIVDLNDAGAEILGASKGVDRRHLRQLLADNPLGQGAFSAPLGIVRRARA